MSKGGKQGNQPGDWIKMDQSHGGHAGPHSGGGGSGGSNHHNDKHKHHKRPCGNPPAIPTGVVMTGLVTEARTHLRFTGKLKWNEVTTDEQGHGTPIRQYDAQFQATDVAGVPVDNEDGKSRIRAHTKVDHTRFGVKNATAAASIATFTLSRNHTFATGDSVIVQGVKPQAYNGTWVVLGGATSTTFTANIGSTPANLTDSGTVFENQTSYHVITHELPRPKSWYWQGRVRAVDKDGCQGDWSAWTTPFLPWTGSDPEPPTPTFTDPGAVTFDNKDKHKHHKLRLLFTFNEVVNWDVPGGDREEDMSHYDVQMDRSDDGSVWDGRPYNRKTVNAKRDTGSADTDDTASTRTVIFHQIRRRFWYRVRVRSVDRFNRRGDWSAWTTPAVPHDTTLPPQPLLVRIFDTTTDRIALDWDDALVDVPTQGTVSGTTGTPTLTGTGTKFTAEVQDGTLIKVGGNTYTVKFTGAVVGTPSDTTLTLTTNLSTSPSALPLFLVFDDPDIAYYEIQIAKSGQVTAGSPDAYGTVYMKDRKHGNRQTFKIPTADAALTFYGRVRTIDAALNKSKWVDATTAGNSNAAVGGNGVGIGAGGGVRYNITFTKPGRLRARHYPYRWQNTSGKTLTFEMARAVVGIHDGATHPADGCPTGGGIGIQLLRWDTSEISTKLFVSDTKLKIDATTHRDTAGVTDFDNGITTLLDGEQVSFWVKNVGSTFPGEDLVVQLHLKE